MVISSLEALDLVKSWSLNPLVIQSRGGLLF